MKRTLTLLVAATLLFSCEEEKEAVPPTPAAPSWSSGYPDVAFGATSVDMNVKTESAAEVYYILSDKPFNYSPEDVKRYSALPDTSAIKASGKVQINARQENSITIPLLEENKEYFAYFVARGPSTDVTSAVSSFDFRTHVRQDTASFISSAEDREVRYLIYRPEEVLKYPDGKYPVCFSFGDKNAVASDVKPINIVRDGSVAEYIYHRNDVPMIVVSPQSITAQWNLDMIAEAIDHTLTTYPADQDRLYLTGYGEGAIAVWNYAIVHEQQIAAIVPVSGRGDIPNACSLSNVDVWASHNEVDNTIASSHTKKMVTAIQKCPPQRELNATYFPDAGHNCWKRVYNNGHADWSKSPGIDKMNIYSWMLTKSKG